MFYRLNPERWERQNKKLTIQSISSVFDIENDILA